MEVNKELKSYIESMIFPSYEKNDLGHNLDHIHYVINRSMKFAKEIPDINYDMVYTIASYHDRGHYIDAKNHEKVSAEMLKEDKNLQQFFTSEQIEVMTQAVYDHRASLPYEPRSIYGKIVSSADRNDSVEKCLRRSYAYGKRLEPEATDEELYERAYKHLNMKFGQGGYAKFFFKDEEYEEFLKEIRELLADKEKFCKTQKEYIQQLKEQGKI